MKSSIFPLILLLMVCFSFSFFLKSKGTFNSVKIDHGESDNILDIVNPFKINKEPFNNVLLKDSENNVVYDLSSNYELYNIDGTLMTAIHDDTDYGSELKKMHEKYEKLQKAKPVKCDNNFKCIANYGTNVGDDLCCGQTGVLQDTRFVCPSIKPTCSNFKCGSVFGTCT